MPGFNSNHERLVNTACRCYRALLQTYPREFRQQYEAPMLTLFRDRLRAVLLEERPFEIVRFAQYALGDWLSTTVRERIKAVSRTALYSFVGALAAGGFTAYVDFHATEVQAPLLVILVTTFVLGIACGRLGWLWALIVAGCLTTAHVLAPHFGILPRDAGHLGNPLSLMVLALPAAVSAYSGATMRRVIRLGRA